MYELHHDRAFSYRRRDALHAARAYVSHGEHARDTGLEQIGAPSEGPACTLQIVRSEIGTGLYKAAAIKRDSALEPCRIGVCAGHGKDMLDCVRFGFSGLAISPRDRLEISGTVQSDDLCP